MVVGAGVLGATQREEFRLRMELAYSQGEKEDNVVGRLQAQTVAFSAALEHPLGVGYNNFPEATRHLLGERMFAELRGSDSIYFDTLLGAGFLGFAILLALFRQGWRHVALAATAKGEALALTRAGLVAVATFGLASVSPMSVFVAPVAFFMLGCAGAGKLAQIAGDRG